MEALINASVPTHLVAMSIVAIGDIVNFLTTKTLGIPLKESSCVPCAQSLKLDGVPAKPYP